MTVEQIVARLDNELSLLTGGSRTGQLRHQTLRATLDWSYELLSEAERTLLKRLSVFAGGWTLEAADYVCGEGVGCRVWGVGERSNPQPAPESTAEAGTDSTLHPTPYTLHPDQVLSLLTSLVDKSLVLF